MLKKSTGNMYPWVTHTKSFLRGKCPHACSYCYVQAMASRFPNLRLRYSGDVTLDCNELQENLGRNRTIFVEHMSDLFAREVPSEWISMVLRICSTYQNRYVFQTKNPARFSDFLAHMFPGTILGTTIETNRNYASIMGNAPFPRGRYSSMLRLPRLFRICVTIEPILDFDLEVLSKWLIRLRPDFVNIGADSKGRGLPEPSPDKIRDLLETLTSAGIRIERKTNLDRLLKSTPST